MNITQEKALRDWFKSPANQPTNEIIQEVKNWIENADKTHATSNVDIAHYYSLLFKKHVEPGGCGGCNSAKYAQIKDFITVWEKERIKYQVTPTGQQRVAPVLPSSQETDGTDSNPYTGEILVTPVTESKPSTKKTEPKKNAKKQKVGKSTEIR